MDEDHSRTNPAAEAAADWFARLQGGGATGDDWLAFEAWLAAAPANARAYERLERLWIEIDEHGAAVAAGLSADGHAARPVLRRGWIAAAGGLLAASLAAAVLLPNLQRAQPPEPQAKVYRAAVGETRDVMLADGTKIRMNADTALRVMLAPDARRVALEHGEAAFDVTHDPARPFLIAVGDREVRVVGTAFDLRRRDGRIVLTVQRGLVEVRPSGRTSGAAVQVPAGRRLSHDEGAAGSRLQPADLNAAYAWTHGQLVYQGASIAEVSGDLSRRFGVVVKPADVQTARTPFTGVLVTDSLSAVLRRLEAFASVKAERTPEGVVLHRRTVVSDR